MCVCVLGKIIVDLCGVKVRAEEELIWLNGQIVKQNI